MIKMNELKVRITTFEGMLGTASADPEIHREFIASKAQAAEKTDEEVEAINADEAFEKQMTVFPRTDGKPIVWDYQIKGFFKDTCGALRKITGTESSKIKAYKKEIDGLIFIKERAIPIIYSGEMGICQRPLRAQTAQGERVALTSSEEIPAGAVIEFTVLYQVEQHEKAIREWLDYGMYRGLGQWRNSGKGRFTWEEVKE
jgi:hypothetical protein